MMQIDSEKLDNTLDITKYLVEKFINQQSKRCNIAFAGKFPFTVFTLLNGGIEELRIRNASRANPGICIHGTNLLDVNSYSRTNAGVYATKYNDKRERVMNDFFFNIEEEVMASIYNDIALTIVDIFKRYCDNNGTDLYIVYPDCANMKIYRDKKYTFEDGTEIKDFCCSDILK